MNGWVENKITACEDLASIYSELGNKDMQLKSLFGSFFYDIPRAEVCCKIGLHFMDKGNYQVAIYWFKEAISKKPNLASGGFYMQDYYDYIPYMELCVAYFKLGNNLEAKIYNDLAGKVKPDDESYLNNVKYFNKLDEEKSVTKE